MDIRKLSLLVNGYFKRKCGGNNRAVYYDIDKIYPELNNITQAYEQIKEEFLSIDTQSLPKYHDIDPRQEKISNVTPGSWKVYMLSMMGISNPKAEKECPLTCEVVKSIPNLMQAFFSILDPGKSVPLHQTPYFGYLRYHLAVEVPNDEPPQIIVKDIPYTWQEKKAVLFDDTWPHEVKNNSTQRRVVLIVDVLRPMPKFASLLNKVILYGLAKRRYAQKAMSQVLLYD
jgi:aspartate beta-hydroxylase